MCHIGLQAPDPWQSMAPNPNPWQGTILRELSGLIVRHPWPQTMNQHIYMSTLPQLKGPISMASNMNQNLITQLGGGGIAPT